MLYGVHIAKRAAAAHKGARNHVAMAISHHDEVRTRKRRRYEQRKGQYGDSQFG
jgi:hypothetical protein